MKITVIQWNIWLGSKIHNILKYLDSHLSDDEPVVICLQEVLASKFGEIANHFGAENCIHSLPRRPKGCFETRERELGVCTIAVNCTVKEHSLVDYSIFPERTLFTRLDYQGENFSVLNFHSLTGASFKKAKSANFKAITSFIADRESDMDFLCFDANEPKKDFRNLEEVIFYDNQDKGAGAAMLMGHERKHSLTDAFRTHIEENNMETAPEPLTISHINRGYPKRFDYIFHSPAWKVHSLEYLFESSRTAGSDHAMVKGVFETRPGSSVVRNSK